MIALKLLLLPALLHAAEDVSAKTNYRVEQVIPGYSASALDAGFPLGRMLSDSQLTISRNTSAKEALAEESRKNASEIEKLKESGKQIQASMQSSAIQEGVDGGTSWLGTTAAAPAQSGRRLQFQSFQACARDAIKTLKTALAAEYRQGKSAADRLMLDLDENRGDESNDGPLGLACGKFLGPASIARPATKAAELKVLMALSAREGEEATRLLETFIASHKGATARALSPMQSLVWTHYWNRLSALAALTSAALPSVEELENALASTPPEELLRGENTDARFESRLQLGDLKEARAAGLSFARRALGGQP